MKRVAFNGGEISPELSLRSDLDVFQRAAQSLVNFDVSQMGGIRRRRGMMAFCPALERSRLVPYVYSQEERFLVEVSGERVRVLDVESAAVLAEFESEFGEVESLRWKQVNNLLLFTHPACAPCVLKRNGSGWWVFEPYVFAAPPWRYAGYRDEELLVLGNADGSYSVVLPDSLPEVERAMEGGDLLRASFYTEERECFACRSVLAGGVQVFSELGGGSFYAQGAKLARRGEASLAFYVCTKDLEAGSFVDGLNMPENYPENFLRAERTEGFGGVQPVNGLSERRYAKGEKIVLRSGYWEFWTCVRAFGGGDFVQAAVSPSDYPGHFVKGLAVGEAVPCRGTWEFFCSGAWYGSYEVRRSYDGPGLDREWESRGISFSRIGAASNVLLSGDESGEECRVRLFLTRSRFMDESPVNGFPDDVCGNRLVVSSYKHDLLLRYWESVDEESGEALASGWHDASAVKVDFTGRRSFVDWSWCAFRPAYGFPLLCEVFSQRLVFASTVAQPQSLWMSRTDDLDRFDPGKEDDAGIAVTLATTSQNAICWMMAHGARLLLGTADAEYVVGAGQSGAVTHANVQAGNHGYVGSAPLPAVMAVDKVLYCERGGTRLYQYGYDFQSDAYVSRDLTVFASHILAQGGGVACGTMLRKPEARAVFVLRDGSMALMTYNSMHEVHCWHRYVTEGRVVSVAVLPNGTRGDVLFLIVEREEGEGTRYEGQGTMEKDLPDGGGRGGKVVGGTRDDVRGTMEGNLPDGGGSGGKVVGGTRDDGRGTMEGNLPDVGGRGGKVKRWIEVMREDGPWMDHGERDYVSEVVTNALTAPDVRAQKIPVAQVQMFLEEESPAEGVEVTADGTVWVKLDRYGMLPKGWNALLASSRWNWECVVGLRVRGERGFALLALQG